MNGIIVINYNIFIFFIYFLKLISFKIFFSNFFLLLLRFISSDVFFCKVIVLSEVNNSVPKLEKPSLPPELMIGPIKKPKSSTASFFLRPNWLKYSFKS